MSKRGKAAIGLKNSPMDFIFSFLTAFMIVFQGTYFPIQVIIISMLLTIYVIVCLAIKKTGSFKIDKRLYFLYLLIFFSYVISTSLSTNKYTATIETIKIILAILFLTASILQQNKESLIKGIFIGCLISSIIGICAYLDLISLPFAILNNGRSFRLQSVFLDANVAALFMGIGFIISMYYMGSSKKFLKRLEYCIYSFIFIITLILTISRSSIILFLLITVVILFIAKFKNVFEWTSCMIIGAFSAYLINYFIQQNNTAWATIIFLFSVSLYSLIYYLHLNYFTRVIKKKKIIFIAILSLCVMMVSIIMLSFSNGSAIYGRIHNMSIVDGTLVERYISIIDSLKAIIKHPFFGIGPDNWYTQQFSYQSAQYYSKYLHNGPLQIFLDAGFLPFVASIILVFIFYKRIFSKIKKNYMDKAYNITLFGVFSFIIIHSLLNADFSYSSIIMVLSGIIANNYFTEIIDENNKDKLVLFQKKVSKFIVGALIVFVPVLLFYLSGQFFYINAGSYYAKGNLDKALVTYEYARLTMPFNSEPYIGIADCYIDESSDKKTVMKNLSKAYAMDIYDIRTLLKTIDYCNSINDYNSSYNFALKTIKIAPERTEGYSAAVEALNNLRRGKYISSKVYFDRAEKLKKEMTDADRKMNPLSKYLQHQVRLMNLSTNLIKKAIIKD